jgi:oxalate decarboxylase
VSTRPGNGTARTASPRPARRAAAGSPPDTDSGSVPNLRFSFEDAYRRVQEGGWSREVTARELPIATELAGVNMSLEPGGVRELHWHKQAEWAYMLDGHAQITAVGAGARPFVDDVGVGDLWYFPAGIPHSIQGLEDGCEFLLVFDDGSFSEDATFLLSDWVAHTPKGILARTLGVGVEDLSDLPGEEKYIFQARMPERRRLGSERFNHRMLAQAPERYPAGAVRVADSRNFPVSTTVAAALVEVAPGAMRELHWHPNTDEWQYYLSGEAQMTVYAAEGRARTFEYRARDVGYVPFAMGHYILNTGDEPLRFLEMFRSGRFVEVSLRRWLASTPARLVADHLSIDERLVEALSDSQQPVLG